MSVKDRQISMASQRKSVSEEPVTSVLAGGEIPDLGRELSADEEVLAALGYKYGIIYLKYCFQLLIFDQTRVQTRILVMDVVLRQFRRPRPAAFFRKYSLLRHGICWNAWYGLGLDHCNVLHPMCGNGDGYEMSHFASDDLQLIFPS